jgi:drug/metabolite transporter (DMT)-like permease
MLPGRHRATLGTLAVVCAAASFGMLGPLSRLAGENAGVSTIGFVSWRALLGAVVVGSLVAVRVARGRRIVGIAGLSSGARASLSAAVLTGVVLNLAIFVAFSRTTIALALLAFYTYPVLVTASVIVIERRHPDRYELAALAMAMVGMAIVVGGGIEPGSGLAFDPLGLGLAFVAAASQTVFVLVSRRGYAEVPTDEASFAVLGGGFVAFALVAVLVGEVGAITGPIGTPAAWPYLVAGGVFGAGIPTTLYILGIRWVGGVRTGILALTEPVVGAALAAALLGESLRPVQLLGGGLVLAAAGVLQASRPSSAAGSAGAPDDGSTVEPAPLV